MGTRKALCVGVNQFANFPDAALRGCVNDANDMADVLQRIVGFDPTDITLLTDSQATKANIMDTLENFVAEAQAGGVDYIAFSMSSHGTQVPDVSGDEPDNADEAFCPYDVTSGGDAWAADHIIIDDELRDLFLTLPQNVLLEIYLDTCHSGDGLKAIDLFHTRRVRYLPPPSLAAFRAVQGRRSRGLSRALLERGIRHHILWAACRSDQTSADAQIDGGFHGAFTYYWAQVMRQIQNTVSRNEVLRRVRAELAAAGYPQIPQLEANATGG